MTLPGPQKGRGGGVRKAWWGGGTRNRGVLKGSRQWAPLPGSPKHKDQGPSPWQGGRGHLAVQGGAWPPEDTVSVGAGFCHLFFPYINFSSFCDEFNFSVCLSSSATAASSPVSGFLPGAGVSPAMVPRTLVLCS